MENKYALLRLVLADLINNKCARYFVPYYEYAWLLHLSKTTTDELHAFSHIA